MRDLEHRRRKSFFRSDNGSRVNVTPSWEEEVEAEEHQRDLIGLALSHLRMQRPEVRPAISSKQAQFAVERDRVRRQFGERLRYAGQALGDIDAVTAKDADPVAIFHDLGAIAVELTLVAPFCAVRRPIGDRWELGLYERGTHDGHKSRTSNAYPSPTKRAAMAIAVVMTNATNGRNGLDMRF
jgi:hypothetical protein